MLKVVGKDGGEVSPKEAQKAIQEVHSEKDILGHYQATTQWGWVRNWERPQIPAADQTVETGIRQGIQGILEGEYVKITFPKEMRDSLNNMLFDMERHAKDVRHGHYVNPVNCDPYMGNGQKPITLTFPTEFCNGDRDLPDSPLVRI